MTRGQWLLSVAVASLGLWWAIFAGIDAAYDALSAPRPGYQVAAPAAAVSIDVERTRIDTLSLPVASVLVRNRGGETVSVSVSCAFLDEAGSALAVREATVPAIAPGADRRQDIRASTRLRGFALAECQLADSWSS